MNLPENQDKGIKLVETSFKPSTIIQGSQVISESKNISKESSPSNISFFYFINALVLIIVEKKFSKNGAGYQTHGNPHYC